MSADAASPEGWSLVYSGKVRDLYVASGETLESAPALLMVASDRVSAFDAVLEPPIPGKGATLTAMTRWWGRRLGLEEQLVPDASVPAELADRALVVRNLAMLPIECVVRGHVAGSGFAEYRETGAISGVRLPAGLSEGDALPEPIFTPAWKAPQGSHDENIPFDRVVELAGDEAAEHLRSASLAIFAEAHAIAATRGLVLADTKLEFGRLPGGEIVVADEILTSDSSRYWDAEALAAGRIESFDKQIVRNWLLQHWDRTGEPPALPAAIVERTAGRYRELLDRLTA